MIRKRRDEIEDIYPLTPLQEGILFESLYSESSKMYRNQMVASITEEIDIPTLKVVVQSLTKQYSVLRTSFHFEGVKKPVQVVYKKVDFEIEEDDWTRCNDHEFEKKLSERRGAEWDLALGGLFRLAVVKKSDKENLIILDTHHIIIDGWSNAILITALFNTYFQLRKGNKLEKVNPLPFKNYVKSLIARDQSNEKEFWRNYLEGVSKAVLPFQGISNENNGFLVKGQDFGTYSFNFSESERDGLLRFSQENRITLNIIYQSCLFVLLHKFTGKNDIVIGEVSSGRSLSGIDWSEMIGLLINTTPTRCILSDHQTVLEVLKANQKSHQEKLVFEHTSLSKINESCEAEDVNSLFQILYVFENYPIDEVKLEELSSLISQVTLWEEIHYPLSIMSFPDGVKVKYDKYNFDQETITRLCDYLQMIMNQVVSNPNAKLVEIDILPQTERKKILSEFNNTSLEFNRDVSIYELFESSVKKTPNKIALEFEGQTLTFKELFIKSNKLAFFLQKRGVASEILVGICLNRSMEAIISILAVLKVGGAYVPIDPNYPRERISFLINDSLIKVLLTSSDLIQKLGSIQQTQNTYEIIELDKIWHELEHIKETPSELANSENLAYVMYTSGSTGTPKGVMIKHRSVVNLIIDRIRAFRLSDNEVILGFSSISFDVSVNQIFLSLFSGSKYVVVRKDDLLSNSFFDLLIRHKVTHCFVTPSFFKEVKLQQSPYLKRIEFAGEICDSSLAKKWAEFYECYNEYGPTEACIYSTSYRVKVEDGKVSIGKPVSNTQVYILSPDLRLVPIGVPGELYIAGEGLAQGYLNEIELTKSRFVENPFASEGKMYKSGDLARWLPDGNLEFLGRIDDQIKLRGHRLEPSEIEFKVDQLTSVTQSKVIVTSDGNSIDNLSCFYVPDRNYLLNQDNLTITDLVSSWNQIWEEEYLNAGNSEKYNFDLTGWKESFTGEVIPEYQMMEWLDDIIRLILSDRTQNVIEIGCGTGMILFGLVDHIDEYTGYDFSSKCIEKVSNSLKEHCGKLPHIDLIVGQANEIDLTKKDVDTIIINSVVQYFPDEDYLSRVLKKSITLLENGGRIIVGDVRDLRLLSIFQSRRLINKIESKRSLSDFLELRDNEVLLEEELCISPDFFYRFEKGNYSVNHVDILCKDINADNELSLYRYNVVLHINKPKKKKSLTWLDCERDTSRENILEGIQLGRDCIAINGLRNPKLINDYSINENIKTQVSNVEYLNRKKFDKEHFDFAIKVIDTAKKNNYKVRKFVHNNPFFLNLILEKRTSNNYYNNYYTIDQQSDSSNIPQFFERCKLVEKEIKGTLNKSLPDYMIPSRFVAMESLPLTTNGKVDRNKLRNWNFDDRIPLEEKDFPKTLEEVKLAEIWEDLLQIKGIGLSDNFFELGGHSLLAMQLMSRIRDVLGVEVRLKQLFESSTLSDLSKVLSESKASTLPKLVVYEKPEKIPLSYSQERLWFLYKLGQGDQYHISSALRVKGKLDRTALQKSLELIVSRHESLRTIFKEEEGIAYQQILDPIEVSIPYYDLRGAEFVSEEINKKLYPAMQDSFNMEEGPLLRTILLHVADDEHIIGISMHHIISDGWSLNIMIKELSESYASYSTNEVPQLAELPIQYADYTLWQKEFLSEERIKQGLDYWQDHLSGYQDLQLPTDYMRPKSLSGEGGQVDRKLGSKLSKGLRDLSSTHQVTLFTSMLSSVYLLLNYYSRQKDIVIGIPTANREHKSTEQIIGFFVNTLVARVEVDEKVAIESLLKRVHEELVESQDHQEVPFEKIVEAVQPPRDLSRSPIFQVMVNYVEVAIEELELNSSISPYEVTHKESKFDLSFEFRDVKEGLQLSLEYSEDLFSRETVDQMMTHLIRILELMVNSPGEIIGSLDLLTQEEKSKLLSFNETAVEYPSDKCIHELFEEVAARNLENIAVEFEGNALTYRELSEKSKKLGLYLQKAGIKGDDLVGVCIDRSIEAIISILGVLQSGGAYVPIDPEYPSDRISYLLADSKVSFILTKAEFEEKLNSCLPEEGERNLVCIDKDWSKIEQVKGRLKREISSQNLAYVIYTSGTTGKPKGVMIEHQSVVRLVVNSNYCKFSEKDTLMSFSAFSFDAISFEYWGPLLNGAKTIICPKRMLLDIQLLEKELIRAKVSVIFITTALFNKLIETEINVFNCNLKTIFVGGEKLSIKHVKLLKSVNKEVRIFNIYGPTENTTFSLYYPIGNQIEDFALGKPISNTTAFILNDYEKLLPFGVVGEICLSGDGVARGYLNRPELTDKKFVYNESLSHKKVYKTGDLGRIRNDGNIEFYGRIDNQVKIRGFRIELEEIESVLAENEKIVSCSVVLGGIDSNKKLVAFYSTNTPINVFEIKAFLRNKLPDYMIPSRFVAMESLPLTTNGKVDRNKLRNWNFDDRIPLEEKDFPKTLEEVKLAEIWEDLLQIKGIGLSDNFFELGGHSLLAMQLMSRIRDVLGVEVRLKQLFESSTLSDLSKVLSESKASTLPKLVVYEKPEKIPLSYSQERLWFLYKLGQGDQYHISSALRVKGKLDRTALQKSLELIVSRHESLRTIFKEEEGIAYQQILDPIEVSIPYYDLRGAEFVSEEINKKLYPAMQDSFNMEEGPLLRTILLHVADDEHIIGISMHHIISDGWSLNIMIKELSESYASYSTNEVPQLAELPIQYADYTLWQKEFLSEERIKQGLDYWQDHLSGYQDLQLPTDYMRPKSLSGEGGQVDRKLGSKLSKGLRDLSSTHQVTLFTSMLSSVYLLLNYYSRQKDIVIGIPTANREHKSTEQIIGFFVNTLVARVEVDEKVAIESLLKRVHEELVESQDHQEVPFEKIVEAVQPPRDLSRSPIFQVMVNYVEVAIEELELNSSISPYEVTHKESKFDLSFEFRDVKEGLQLSLEYSEDLFSRETVDQMMTHLIRILELMVNSPGEIIGSLDLLTQEEKSKLLSFNETAVEYPSDKCIHELFEEVAARNLENIAVEFEGNALTYRELSEKSKKLGLYLQKAGIKGDDLVGVCIDRSIEAIISILGVLQSGGAYVPIDPEYPSDRISYLLADSKVSIILTKAEFEEKLNSCLPEEGERNLVCIDKDWSKIEQVKGRLKREISSQNLAYVIYTSGTTGKPKGVMIEHQSVVNLIIGQISTYGMTQDEVILGFSSISFDTSVEQIFISLCLGAKYVIVRKEDLLKGNFTNLLEIHKISHCDVTPSFISGCEIDRVLPNLNRIVFGGETLTKEIIETWSKNFKCFNAYGPTEACVTTSVYSIVQSDKVLIGRPIPNMKAYVLNEDLICMPIGVKGELYIAGDGLFRGYLNNEQLSSARLVYRKESDELLYRSGDLARWLPNGDLEYLGRVDDQIKIRGYRIEPKEIENVLKQCDLVNEGVIHVHNEKAGLKHLVCFVSLISSSENDEADISQIKKFLTDRLPPYMIPSIIIPIEEIPLTINGKLDKRALENFKIKTSLSSFSPPRNKTDELLSSIWTRLLDIENIGIKDDFFDLGGHSLLITRLLNEIRREFNVELSVSDVFGNSTIEELSSKIETKDKPRLTNISHSEKQENIPLSFAQERLWFLHELGGSIEYHVPIVYSYKGSINSNTLESAFLALIKENHALRTVIKSKHGKPYQELLEVDNWKISIESLKDKEEQPFINSLVRKPFSLSEDYMIRVHLLKGRKNYLVIVMHHIAVDGWSLPILFNDVKKIYELGHSGTSKGSTQIPIQYSDYAIWQRENFNDKLLEDSLNYWERKLSNSESLLLPKDFNNSNPSEKGAVYKFILDSEIKSALELVSKNHGTTIYTTLIAIFKVLLFRYSGQQDICIGIPVANRPQKELETVIGFFVNTLVIRSHPQKGASFDTYLHEVNNTLMEAYEHSNVPFEKVVNRLKNDRDLSANPLFQVMISTQGKESNYDLNLDGVHLEQVEVASQAPKFDIILDISEGSSLVNFSIEYNSGLFSKNTIVRMATHFMQLIKSVIQNKFEILDRLNMMGREEKATLLSYMTKSEIEYSYEDTIVSLFEKQVNLFPDSPAVSFQGKSITYGELNCRANKLAHFLLENNSGPETLVPICFNRSIEMIVSIIGVLKSGAGYVPIDPNNPITRIEFILKDVNAKLIVLDELSEAKLRVFESWLTTIVLSDYDTLSNQSDHNPNSGLTSKNVAYTIYTSGSTGQPKGVLINHQNVVRLFFNEASLFDFSKSDVWTLFHSYCFDFSVWEIFGPLLHGGRLAIVPSAFTVEPLELAKFIYEERVTVLNQTPSIFRNVSIEIINYSETSQTSLRYVIFGGEELNPKMLEKFHDCFPEVKLINMYGITETTVHVSYKEIGVDEIEKGQSVIGRPIPTTDLYVMDDQLQIQPFGVVGELVVGGAGLAREYLNNPSLTQKKFVQNPAQVDSLLYLSGDLGYLREDGEVVYIGRKDSQIKIRGFRIEPKEIESCLAKHDSVIDSKIILSNGTNQNKNLIAFYISDTQLEPQSLRHHILQDLPNYMIPNFFVWLKEFPVNENGKLDVASLLRIFSEAHINSESVAEISSLENELIEIWKNVLQIHNIGTMDNFFASGGDSIKAIRLASEINRILGTSIRVEDIFRYNNIHSLSLYMDTMEQEDEVLIASKKYIDSFRTLINDTTGKVQLPSDIVDIYPMSDIEKGMIFHNLGSTENIYHNQLYYQFNSENFEFPCLKEAFSRLVEKHEILRTSFRITGFSEPIQIVHEYSPSLTRIYYEDLSQMSERSKKNYLKEFLARDQSDSFDLNSPGMYRMFLFNLGGGRYGVLWVHHHAIIDGWSDALFIGELFRTYSQLSEDRSVKLSKLKSSYKDYIIDQVAKSKSLRLRNFWIKELNGYHKSPLPFNREVSEKDRASVIHFEYFIEESLCEKLDVLAAENLIGLKDIFLAAFCYTIKLFTGSKEVTVGLVANNRPGVEDGDRILGCFLNTIPFRLPIPSVITTQELLGIVSQKLSEVLIHSGLSFFKILELSDYAKKSASPIFDIIFNYVDFPVPNILKSGFVIEKPLIEGNALTNTQFDFSVDRSRKNKISIRIDYSSSSYSKSEINSITNQYVRLLELFVKPKSEISIDRVLSKYESRKLLKQSNGYKLRYESSETILNLFDRVVFEKENHTAVSHGDVQISYGELHIKSNQIANLLIRRPPESRKRIAICVDRSIAMISGLLGILKSGGSYVPIDPTYPIDRINDILDDIDSQILLCDSSSKNLFSKINLNIELITLDDFDSKIDEEEIDYRGKYPLSSDIAYIMFTSGTTGKPKGVMVEHKSLTNLFLSQRALFQLSQDESILLFSNFTFDASVEQICLALLSGARLVIVDLNTILDKNQFSQFLVDQKVTHLHATPSYLNQVELIEPNSLKRIISGGENCNPSLLKKFHKYPFYNEFGPTEATVTVLTYCVNKNSPTTHVVPIGKPIANTQVYVLDEEKSLVKYGVVGELYIGGHGLSRGYFNDEELTREKFIKNPFAENDRLYRTGDMVRWRRDGNLEFLHRNDDQVKVRGYRVELQEIEAILYNSGLVKQAVVLAIDSQIDSKELIAYVICDKESDIGKVENHLQQKLPEYMLPQRIISVEEIPLTNNGKVNKFELCKHVFSASSNEKTVKAASKLESYLIGIWRKFLNANTFGITDDFFEIGGNSLIALQIISEIQLDFTTNSIHVSDLLEHPTIEKLAKLLDSSEHPKHRLDPHILNFRSYDEGDGFDTFIIPGMPGIVDGYYELAKALPFNGSVYGLQMKGVIDSRPLQTIEEMALHNINLIKKVSKDKRINLVAHSYGGTVLFEMINRLKDAGFDIGKIILVDAFRLNVENHLDKELAEVICFSLFNMEALAETSLYDRIIEILEGPKLNWKNELFRVFEEKNEILKKQFLRLWSLVESSLSIKYNYDKTLDMEVVVVSADDRSNLDCSNDWVDLFTEATVLYSNGNHFSIVKEPFCSEWLSNISQSITK